MPLVVFGRDRPLHYHFPDAHTDVQLRSPPPLAALRLRSDSSSSRLDLRSTGSRDVKPTSSIVSLLERDIPSPTPLTGHPYLQVPISPVVEARARLDGPETPVARTGTLHPVSLRSQSSHHRQQTEEGGLRHDGTIEETSSADHRLVCTGAAPGDREAATNMEASRALCSAHSPGRFVACPLPPLADGDVDRNSGSKYERNLPSPLLDRALTIHPRATYEQCLTERFSSTISCGRAFERVMHLIPGQAPTCT